MSQLVYLERTVPDAPIPQSLLFLDNHRQYLLFGLQEDGQTFKLVLDKDNAIDVETLIDVKNVVALAQQQNVNQLSDRTASYSAITTFPKPDLDLELLIKRSRPSASYRFFEHPELSPYLQQLPPLTINSYTCEKPSSPGEFVAHIIKHSPGDKILLCRRVLGKIMEDVSVSSQSSEYYVSTNPKLLEEAKNVAEEQPLADPDAKLIARSTKSHDRFSYRAFIRRVQKYAHERAAINKEFTSF